MDKKLACLRLLAKLDKSDWKIGQTNAYVNMISKRASALPENVFDKFSLESDASKKISIIDFVILTYNMGRNDRKILMDQYGIRLNDVIAVLNTADAIATDIEKNNNYSRYKEYER